MVMNQKSCLTKTIIGIVTLFQIVVGPLIAQIGASGAIQGRILDPNGAVIVNATVTGTNVATGVKTIKQTNDSGVYLLTPLTPGAYFVTVTAEGFQTLIQEQVIVDAQNTVGLNLTLKVGLKADTVTITAAPAQLNTTDSRLGTTMRN